MLRLFSRPVLLPGTLGRYLSNAVIPVNVDLTQRALVAVVDHTPQHLATKITYGASLVGGQLKVVPILGDIGQLE